VKGQSNNEVTEGAAMTILVRTSVLKALLLLGGGVVLATVALLAREATRKPAPDTIEGQMRLSDELDEKARGVVRRLYRKERVLQMHLAGRLTLLEAAAHFRNLDQQGPLFRWEQFREQFDGNSDDERHCREVIAFVRAALNATCCPTTQEKVQRLEAELRQHLRRGPLRLPDVEPLDEE
jgi:hypothetical protein